MPDWNDGQNRIKLVAGNAFGKSAPLQGFSPLFMVDIYAEESNTLQLKDQLKGEVAFVIVEGKRHLEDEEVGVGQMLISKTDHQCEICLEKGTRLLLFGGEPLEEEHFLLWNFVSHSKERLQQAKEDCKAQKFPKVPGDKTYIPIPEK